MAAILSCAVAYAAVRTNTHMNGASNWNDSNSYTDTSFVPSNHEDVVIMAGIGIRCGFGDIDPETAAAQIREICSRALNFITGTSLARN